MHPLPAVGIRGSTPAQASARVMKSEVAPAELRAALARRTIKSAAECASQGRHRLIQPPSRRALHTN